ncbi:hypothetical protein NSS71_08650 [Niallia sp. FSL W8-0951]|uniref:competence protein CoiA family protein n=1 Tax=Niallia sp. FSL W8-0951 TaxID=2954639 RepID=UPI0030F9B6B5
MSYENVTIWFAKNEDGEIITINEINESNKRNHFLCPVCGSDVIPRAIKSKHMSQHFAHLDKDKCNNETMIHWWYKNRFLEKGDKFTVVSDKERDYVVSKVLVEQEYETSERTYNPDVTVLTECGNRIFFEMKYSNDKDVKDYIDIWLELRDIVVEIDIKQLMLKEKVPKFKALFYEGKCFNTKRNDSYYNTIGKHKEYLYKYENDEKIKSRIKQLDWFWDDVIRYKEGNKDAIEMAMIIDTFSTDDKDVIMSLLKKAICGNLYSEYKRIKSLDDIVKFNTLVSENNKIAQFVKRLNDKYKNFDNDIYITLKHKERKKSKTYYNGSRRHPYKSYDVFSHYEYYIAVEYDLRLIKAIWLTNRINEFSTVEQLDNVIYNSLNIKNKKVKKECIDCHKGFFIKFAELKYYIKRDLIIPKRCKECRKKRRQLKESEENN